MISEKSALKISTWAAAAFALLGLAWGLIIRSGMLLFDGVYSLLSVALSLMSLVVLNQVTAKKEDSRYPFGKAHFEPYLVLFKSLVLIGMCVISFSDALRDLLSGGKIVAPGPAALYSLISTLGCLVTVVFLFWIKKKNPTGLLEAEYQQWLGDTLLSLVVLAGFILSYLSVGTKLEWIVPYMDPFLVTLMSLIFLVFPLRTMFSAYNEFMFMEADDEIKEPVEAEVRRIADELEARYKLRMVKKGRETSIEVNFITPERSISVEDMDRMRNRIKQKALKVNDLHWINIGFTRLEEWL
ncbi:MAG: cation transporter [Spirochaetales bacterium]|nr:cation transporter [Spirochaetales bacterium]